MLAQRTNRVKPSPTLAVSGKAKTMKAEGIDVVDFSVGEPDFPTPAAIKEAGIQAIRDNHTTYTAGPGTPALRKAICGKLLRDHGLSYTPEEIIVCTGAKHALYNVAMALFDEGDEVLIPSPCWVSYVPQVALADARAVCVETSAETGFKITPAQLQTALTPRTKAFLLNNPSNPTGGTYTRAELAALAEVLAPTNVWVITDEIYEKLVYDNFVFTSFPSLDPIWKNRTVLINGVSKAYAMTGWRIGYAAAPVELIKGMSKIQDHSTSNANSIAQQAAIAALTGPQDEIEQMRKAFEERRNLMHKLMTALPEVTCFKPQGAFYLFADFSAYLGRTAGDLKIGSCVDLADFILAEAHTAVVPGAGFEVTHGYLRFSYASSPERIKEGMRRVAEALAKLS